MEKFANQFGTEARKYLQKIKEGIDRAFENIPAEAPEVFRPGPYPLVNIYEGETEYVIRTELPGVSRTELDVSIAGHKLTISGVEREDPEVAALSCVRRERGWGEFSRTIELPDQADVEAEPEAKLSEGVLKVRIPKKESSRPRKINIEEQPADDPSEPTA